MNETTLVQFGENSGFIADLLRQFREDSSLVDNAWHPFLAELSNGHGNGHANGSAQAPRGEEVSRALLIDTFRRYGHLLAHTNPLASARVPDAPVSELQSPSIDQQLAALYCGSTGYEFGHITSIEERTFLYSSVEASRPLTDELRLHTLRELLRAELFESEVHRKYVGAKRFSAQGGESATVMAAVLLRVAAEYGVEHVVVGMPHRGRLGLVTNCLGKPLVDLLREFEDKTQATVIGSGDVKYHLGASGLYGQTRVELLCNPSHLEAVNPVVEGVVRALQDTTFAEKRRAVLGLRFHGDAAVMGQGVFTETLNMSQLRGYRTEGSFHIIVNNNIGFTTDPEETRSSRYCSDWAKALDCPIIHVNGEDADACARATLLLLAYRQKFGKDVVLDVQCYRKYGHNEGDDPSYTQPAMYEEIKARKPLYELYGEKLIAESVTDSGTLSGWVDEYRREFDDAQIRAKATVVGACSPIRGVFGRASQPPSVQRETLEQIAQVFSNLPADFSVHPKLKVQLEKRAQSVLDGKNIEWGFAELLAHGTLSLEGVPIRLTGQDVGRGTFSHRHGALTDIKTGRRYLPISALGGAPYEIFNSPLSEIAVVGFEFGYAATRKNALTIWEAQFGDFSNVAQVLIDQFIASSEAKWSQVSGLVMLLPHGFEGQGPEHSSARLERYLQLCGDGNMTVCVPSSATSYFHLLRRHAHTKLKRPLIIITPKSLLRMPAAYASVESLTSGGFEPTIVSDYERSATKPDQVILCAGKIFYELDAKIRDTKRSMRIVRLEELHPFPSSRIAAAVEGARRILWVQEEPKNQGAWSYVEPLLREMGVHATFIGRPASAAPAGGSPSYHNQEQAALLSAALA